MTVSNEAVEAAARGLFCHTERLPFSMDNPSVLHWFTSKDPECVELAESLRNDARAALEAAAPHMLSAPEGVSEAEKRVAEWLARWDAENDLTRDTRAILLALSSERERADSLELDVAELEQAAKDLDFQIEDLTARAQAAETKVNWLKGKLSGDNQIGTLGKAKDLVVVHRRHTGTSAQRKAAARVVGHFYGSPSWDVADAIVEAWTNAAPPEQSLIAALRWTETQEGE